MPDTPAQVVDTRVLQEFTPWAGIVPGGYFAYFLGNKTRADYWAFSKETRALYDRERFEAFSGPSIDDNIFDWLVLLEAVVETRREFTMAAIGAGWGRWLVAAVYAVRQRGDVRCRLIGIEAEPTHFRWMREHFLDNGINPDDHDLIEAAATGRSGEGWFYVGKPDAWYGQSLIADEALDNKAPGSQVDYMGEKAMRVRTIDLATVAANYTRIDYLHMDAQGAELDILSNATEVLDGKVKRVLVGTHSAEIERGLREMFRSLGWRLQYDVPMNGQAKISDTVVTLGDGVQVWINPAL